MQLIRPTDPARTASDEARFCAWVDPHWAIMRRVAWRLSAAGETEDVVQNALLAAWRHRHRFDESRGSAAAWLTTITVNEARKSHRGRRRTEVLADQDPVAPEPPPPAGDLARAIDGLPARQALAVHLHYYADLPIREVASAMGCAEGTVKSTLSAAPSPAAIDPRGGRRVSDDLHRTLVDDGARWRSRLPAGASPATVLARADPAGPRRAGGWAATAAAAVVAAVAIGAVLITHRADGPAAGSARPCEQQFRVASIDYRSVPAQPLQNLVVRLTYTGRSACAISAYGPLADLLAADGQEIGVASHTTLELIRPDQLTVNRDDTVEFTVRWSPPCAARLPFVSVMLLRMKGLDAPPSHRVRVAVPDNYRPACGTQFVDQSRIGGFVGAAHVTRA